MRTTRPYGDHAAIADCASLAEVLGLTEAVRASDRAGIADVVPGARTVTVLVDPVRLPVDIATEWLARLEPREHEPAAEELVTIEVEYSGQDLAEVARATGLSEREVVDAHTGAAWRVAFTGFAPGFGYLVCDDARLRVPRRAHPRTDVSAGAVALAGEFSGVYPRGGAGGWQLIGRTDAAMWDETREPPALLTPGTRVRFREVGADAGGADAGGADAGGAESATDVGTATNAGTRGREAGSAPDGATPDPEPRASADAANDASAASGTLTVLQPGPRALIEDRGRVGMARYGAGRSGALDRHALGLANRLVGNDADAAGIEFLLGNARVRFDAPAWFAVTGAGGPLSLDGRVIEPDEPVRAQAGAELRIGPPDRGARQYLAVRGGILAPLRLGSRSRDTGAGIGPSALAAGDRVPIGPRPTTSVPAADTMTVAVPDSRQVLVHTHPGPRESWFTSDAVAAFYDTDWVVGAQADRVGVRLTGAVLERAVGAGASPDAAAWLPRDPVPAADAGAGVESEDGRSAADEPGAAAAGPVPRELPSEAMLPGAIQVPPSGEPVVLLADHPVTGGYPVIAVVSDADLDLFAQLRPGQVVRFRHAH